MIGACKRIETGGRQIPGNKIVSADRTATRFLAGDLLVEDTDIPPWLLCGEERKEENGQEGARHRQIC